MAFIIHSSEILAIAKISENYGTIYNFWNQIIILNYIFKSRQFINFGTKMKFKF